MNGPVGRLAPSPTGVLHLGHAWSFLLAWWSARAQGGRVLLRLEDLDAGRSTTEYCDLVRLDLEWLGLDWDEECLQSDHVEAIRAAAFTLAEQGRAFACTCSRGDVRSALSAPHAPETQLYPGTCRNRYASLAAAEKTKNKPAGLRFLAPDRAFSFSDALQGPYSENLTNTSGDFLILRRDKTPAYQLAVVVDDAAAGVTEIVRGRDLLGSTPRQLALYEALGQTPPRYAHVPLVLDAEGQRLAKRHDALGLCHLRQRGVDARAVVGWVAKNAGLDVPDRVAAHEVTKTFSLDALPKGDVQADDVTLNL